MKRGKVTALVMAFIMAVSVLASPVTMLNTNAAVKAKKITMAKNERFWTRSPLVLLEKTR